MPKIKTDHFTYINIFSKIRFNFPQFLWMYSNFRVNSRNFKIWIGDPFILSLPWPPKS